VDYNYNHYKGVRRRSTPTVGYHPKGRKNTARLLASLALFAGAVLAKLLAPSLSERMGGELLRAIDSDVDYRAAFAAVGSFVSGDYTLGQAIEAMKAAGGEGQAAEEVLLSQETKSEPEMFQPSGAAEKNLQTMYLDILEATLKRKAEAETQPVMAADEEVLHYEAQSDALPENVCGDYEALPFEYTMPVTGVLSSAFGYRDHPIDGVRKFHYGTDFEAAEGTEIRAFADGYVAASGISETAGKYLIISHGDGWVSQYFHCSEVYMTGGSEVAMGDVVAAVGQTGTATGPNLHFELICDGVYFDPWLYLHEQS